ncbi:unnamed protein product [Callosobruchus maculatus]|uniref:Uncharacterized protein n=1 Tax=Callosobruchus maculatus TaxID=64391 RepID=A0A653D7E0_CALMS|nr:unnamed protein product [Callosobruchus maculatus]
MWVWAGELRVGLVVNILSENKVSSSAIFNIIDFSGTFVIRLLDRYLRHCQQITTNMTSTVNEHGVICHTFFERGHQKEFVQVETSKERWTAAQHPPPKAEQQDPVHPQLLPRERQRLGLCGQRRQLLRRGLPLVQVLGPAQVGLVHLPQVLRLQTRAAAVRQKQRRRVRRPF